VPTPIPTFPLRSGSLIRQGMATTFVVREHIPKQWVENGSYMSATMTPSRRLSRNHYARTSAPDDERLAHEARPTRELERHTSRRTDLRL